jgi:CubicO group peptidase (beta-lactamase class C family)
MRDCRLILVSVVIIFAMENPQAAGIRSEAIESVRNGLHGAIDSPEIAGTSLLIVRDGEEVLFDAGGVADVDNSKPFGRETIVRIYSMTKPITSVAAMILFEQGKFGLDDPVSRFIPAFASTTVLEKDGEATRVVPAKRQITVRDVFRHTTGFSYGDGDPSPLKYYEREGMRYRPPAAMLPPEMSIEKGAAALARIPALHHPGERFTYGFSTDLLGRLIEVWSGKSLDQYLKETLFDPLEMVDTAFSIPESKRARFASCHILKEGELVVVDGAEASEFNGGFEFLSGGGGLLSTIDDYGKFCQMLVDWGSVGGKSLIKRETLDLMFTDQLDEVAGDFKFGLGFAIAEINLGEGAHRRKAAQYSWAGYASTDFRIVPKEKLFQIMFRQQVPSSHGLANRLFRIAYDGLE